jgi:hypothetical protein
LRSSDGIIMQLRGPWQCDLLLAALGLAAGLCVPDVIMAAEPLTPLTYNHPGLTVDLHVGLWAYPVVYDHDRDGDLDLIVACPDKPMNGVWLFENPGPPGTKQPVFLPPRKLGGPAPKYLTLSWVDGVPRALDSHREYPQFLTGDWKTKVDLYPRDRVAPIKYLRSNTWHLVDYDGDGLHDLIVGHDRWDNFGSFDTNDWWKKFDAQGQWHGGELRGEVYWLKNTGSQASPNWADPVPVMAGSVHVETYGAPTPQFADFDGDGDLDLVCGEFLDGFTYYVNRGTRKTPKYADGVRLPVRMNLQMVVPHAVDWDTDGDVDLVVGDEDGRVAFIENTGRMIDEVPEFLPPDYFEQQASDIDVGALATPVGCDWDGDGDDDIITGNTAGDILFVENLRTATPGEPRWARPHALSLEGAVTPFRILAGENGSIQGPAEAKWGYTTLSVVDWDADADLDIVFNSIWGRVQWLQNTGTPTAPQLAAPQDVAVAWTDTPPKPAWTWWTPARETLATQWRTTPAAVDWNRDGLVDLVMLDHEGWLCLWTRRSDGRLSPPARVLVDANDQPLHFNAGLGGRSGRRKLCITDWDADGRWDLLANSQNGAWHRQLEAVDGRYRFAAPVNVSDRNIEGHDTSPTTIDIDGDGTRELLIGAEDGRLYVLQP